MQVFDVLLWHLLAELGHCFYGVSRRKHDGDGANKPDVLPANPGIQSCGSICLFAIVITGEQGSTIFLMYNKPTKNVKLCQHSTPV